MISLDKALTWFIRGWVALVVALNLFSIAAIFIVADSVGAGLSRLWSIFSPYNLTNYFLEVALLSPAIGAALWRDNRRKREQGW